MGIQFGHGIFIQWHILDFTLGKVYHFQPKRDQIKVPTSTGILIGSLDPTREYLEQCTNDDIYLCNQEIRTNRYMTQSLRKCFFVPQYSPVQQNQKTIPVLRKKKPNELKSWHWHQFIRESNTRLGSRAICMLSRFSHINNENSIMGSVATSFFSFSKILTMDVPWLAPVWARYDVSFVSLQYYIPVDFFKCCDGYNVG